MNSLSALSYGKITCEGKFCTVLKVPGTTKSHQLSSQGFLQLLLGPVFFFSLSPRSTEAGTEPVKDAIHNFLLYVLPGPFFLCSQPSF